MLRLWVLPEGSVSRYQAPCQLVLIKEYILFYLLFFETLLGSGWIGRTELGILHSSDLFPPSIILLRYDWHCWYLMYTNWYVCVLSRSVVSNSLWPMAYSQPGSSVCGILQARILEWATMPSSRRSYQPRVQTRISYISGTGRRALHLWICLHCQTIYHLQVTYCPVWILWVLVFLEVRAFNVRSILLGVPWQSSG